MISAKPIVVAIVGPTAVGKTAVTIQLAEHFGCEIISADSRQFYREMTIGTAKPSTEELSKVKHHFINSHSIKNEINAGTFESEANAVLHELFKKGRIVFVTGGSGLYVKALLQGLPPMPKIEESVRQAINTLYSQDKGDELLKELKEKDFDYYNVVDKSNFQRVIRALEVIRSTGRPFSDYRNQPPLPKSFDVITVGLTLPREELYDRINKRVDQMIENGLIDEVKTLVSYKDSMSLQTVGYAEVFEYLDGDCDLNTCIENIKTNTRRYAKRQMTWFRRQHQPEWFSPEQTVDIRQYIEKKMMRG